MTNHLARFGGIVLNPTHISDMFFNFDLENYNRVMSQHASQSKEDDSGTDVIREAIKKDAIQFASCCGQSDNDEFIEALADDFLKRV